MFKAEKPIHILFHLGLILLIIFVIAYVFFKIYLPATTHHNERIVVPSLKGKTMIEAKALLQKFDLRYFINDSTYIEGKKPDIILAQHPDPGSEVKKNRKIYLTLSAFTPPKVKMPKLTDRSLKNAELTLKSFDLKVGEVTYETSPYKDLVLSQYIGEKETAPGTYVPKGSRINLKVGNGEAGEKTAIPYLVGMTREEAETTLKTTGLIPGIIAFDNQTTEPSGLVTRQSPDPSATDQKMIRKGSSIDLWISE